jgi:hypothetical protein
MVVPDHVGRLQVLVIDGVIGTNERQRCLLVKIPPLATHLLMRPGK